jgi:hypothetical protein
MLRVAHASRPALAAPRRTRAARRITVAAAQPRRRGEPPMQRLALSLRTLTDPVARASTPQKVLVTSLGASAALLVLRWRAVLSAIAQPALALAAVGWVLAHERRAPTRQHQACSRVHCVSHLRHPCSRAALEDDFLLLIHPERPRRTPRGPREARLRYDAELLEPEIIEVSDEEDEEDEPEEGPWDGGFQQRASVLEAQRPDLLRGVGGDGPKSWTHGPPPA